MLLSLASAKLDLQRMRCQPVTETMIYTGFGVLSHQGPVDLYLGWDADVLATVPIRQVPCLRVGLREHFTWTSMWIEEGANGYEMIFKTQAMVGSYGKVSRTINMGGYLLAGVKAHHVRQDVDYPERDIKADYTGTAYVPSVYLYSTVDYFPWENVGMNFNISIPIFDFEREAYWYANRIVGIGLQLKK